MFSNRWNQVISTAGVAATAQYLARKGRCRRVRAPADQQRRLVHGRLMAATLALAMCPYRVKGRWIARIGGAGTNLLAVQSCPFLALSWVCRTARDGRNWGKRPTSDMAKPTLMTTSRYLRPPRSASRMPSYALACLPGRGVYASRGWHLASSRALSVWSGATFHSARHGDPVECRLVF